jgi:Uma2 family endonuclease
MSTQTTIMRRGIDGLEHLDGPPMKPLPTVPISFEEFLDWCDEDTRAEWVNGKVVLLSPDSFPHGRIFRFLLGVLGAYVEERHLGEVAGPNFMMKMDAIPSGRMPDILFMTREQMEQRLKHTHLNEAAALAVEIVSPESVDRDEDEKFREYAKAGVREYWLINPMRQAAAFFELKRGRYEPLPVQDGVVRSRVVDGFYLRTEWLWQIPSMLDALRELGVLGRVQ